MCECGAVEEYQLGTQRKEVRAQHVLFVFYRHCMSNVRLRLCGFFGGLYVISA
jgi:hypothetical protein